MRKRISVSLLRDIDFFFFLSDRGTIVLEQKVSLVDI